VAQLHDSYMMMMIPNKIPANYFDINIKFQGQLQIKIWQPVTPNNKYTSYDLQN
jgi:hypothetical protein